MLASIVPAEIFGFVTVFALTVPAVTFATLPRLTAASGGLVPNPYQR